MKIIYNKQDVEDAIKVDLEAKGMNLDKKVIITERVKDLIHVSIEDEKSILDLDDE